jgi:pimeloyl-ACP methyl ester carboxylesterase
MIPLRHGRVTLALHELRAGSGPALLCLPPLLGSAAAFAGAAGAWPGPVYALDFAGHGRSGWLRGGGYTPELLAGDADVALARLGRAHLAGAGIGAYVALLVAGARPAHVPAALLLPGAGLEGGGALPDPEREPSLASFEAPEATASASVDPRVAQLARDVRPVDYAEAFAGRARRLLLLEDGSARPPWWAAAAKSAAAEAVAARDLAAALARLADATTQYLSSSEA